MLTSQWIDVLNVSEESSAQDDAFERGRPADNDDSSLDAGRIGRECELQLLRRSSLIHVKIRPVELPARGV